MLTLVLLAALPLFPPSLREGQPLSPPERPELCDVAAAHQSPGRELTKKEKWLAEKANRVDIHLTSTDLPRSKAPARKPPALQVPLAEAMPPPTGTVTMPVTTLFNLKTREILSLVPGLPPGPRLNSFLRDHYTNQPTQMDERLLNILTHVARRFSAGRIDVVSGYRSPKYNMMLRKKGHEVARFSQHTEGNAVDFRLRGVPTRRLLNYVKSLKIGGVGYYPHSQFVHGDTGRVRYWRGS